MYFRKRGKKWYYAFTVKDQYGEKKVIERVGGSTRREAAQTAHKAMRERMAYYGQWEEPERMQYQEYFPIFIREYAEVFLKPATVRSYRSIGKNHLLPDLGQVELRLLTSRMLQNYINSKKDTLSHGTLAMIVRVLSKSLAYACTTCGFIYHNPAQLVRVPPAEEAKPAAHVFSDDEMEELFEAFPLKHRFHAPLVLAYHTGMRLGECLALKWSDVDFKEKVIHIHATMFDDHGVGTVQKKPKSESSIRTISMGQTLIRELTAIHKRQSALRLEAGPYWKGEDFVCCREDGSPMTSDTMRYFGQFCKKHFGAGSFHALRHTHATRLLESGVSLELVSKRLGHSSILITSKVYSHVQTRRIQQTRAVLDQIF